MASLLEKRLERATTDEERGRINMELASHWAESSLTSEGRGRAKDYYHNAMVRFKRAANTVDAAACIRLKADIIMSEQR